MSLVELDRSRGREIISSMLEWEKEKLAGSLEDIWGDEEIPEEMRRILLLIKLGLGTNPHVFMYGRDVRDNLEFLHQELHKEFNWELVQGTTSTPLDEVVKASPLIKLRSEMNISELRQARDKVEEDFLDLVVDQVDEGEKLADQLGDELKEGFWEEGMFIFYPNRWKGKGRKKMIGGKFMVQTSLRTPKWHREDVMSIEMTPGVMGREVKIGTDGFFGRYIGKAAFSPNFGVIPVGTGEKFIEKNGGITGDQLALRKLVEKKISRKLLRDPWFRHQISALQRLLGTNEIVFDFYYYEPEGRILCIDFDYISEEKRLDIWREEREKVSASTAARLIGKSWLDRLRGEE